MASMFELMGFKPSEKDMEDIKSESDIFRKLLEMREEIEKQASLNTDNNYHQEKKSKKQLEKEAREHKVEEANNKNINSLYKQLVKTFHPVLEQDEDLKRQKEGLMKQITVAY